MIYVTGDLHGSLDIDKLKPKYFPDQAEMTKSDYIIICGDFGLVWNGGNDEKYWLKWLDKKNFTTLFVDGNHENHQMLSEMEVIDFHGGRAHQVSESVYHLMRGEVYTIEGKKLFTMGGATSQDQEWRTEGETWWPEEIPSPDECGHAVKNLTQHGWRVDFIFSHCAPSSVQHKLSPHYKYDFLNNFFETTIKGQCSFDKWFFGHYHEDINVDDKFICLYDKIIRIV